MRIIVADYGAGNLYSISRAFDQSGVRVLIESRPERWLDGDALVFPGVGAFGPAAARLAPVRDRLRKALAGGHPALGICLGFQLLFDSSDEGPGAGLGLFGGHVERLAGPRVPHMGWTPVDPIGNDPFLGGVPFWAWFAHSFAVTHEGAAPLAGLAAPDTARPAAPCREEAAGVLARTTWRPGAAFVSAARCGATLGVQFHPEKSGRAGQRLLQRFLARATAARGGAA